jgi:hypothetical protein
MQHVILSYGMGVESTAILLRWIYEPSTRPCSLGDLLVITAQTGDEYEDTRRDVEAHILPLLREHGIRFVQIARRGHLEADGIAVLADDRNPRRLHTEGSHKLSDELRSVGTVPQFGGEHRCSLKFKAFVIETWLRDYFPHPFRHGFGYNADEPKRAAKSQAADVKRVAFGFNAEEGKRMTRTLKYDRADRQSFFPLIEWGWTREHCLEYIESRLGIRWLKSACVYCPFNRLTDEAIERHKQHPQQVASALALELVSLTLNPRGTLYKEQSLRERTEAGGNQEALRLFEDRLNSEPWRIYRVRRVYAAKKDEAGHDQPDRKGNAMRAVEHASEILSMSQAKELLQQRSNDAGISLEQKRGISYLYLWQTGPTYPTREEYYVAGPAVVQEKTRYGLDWFEEQWEPRQAMLFAEDKTPNTGASATSDTGKPVEMLRARANRPDLDL